MLTNQNPVHIWCQSAFVTGADIDKYLQHASTFAKHMHGVQIFLCLL